MHIDSDANLSLNRTAFPLPLQSARLSLRYKESFLCLHL